MGLATQLEPRRPTPDEERGTWAPGVFVWSVGVVLFVIQLVGLARYAVNVPYWDDWFNVPFLTGQEPVTLGWLWDQTPGAETRTPLYRFLFVALFRAGGNDVRALQLVNVLALAALAFALVRVATRLRGRAAYADAFFPCLLLHWGQAEVFLWATMTYITIPLALAGGLLLLIVQTRDTLTLPRSVLGGSALVLLPLCGTSGLVFVPFVGLWLAMLALRAWRTGRKAASLAAVGFGVTTCLLTVAFFLGDYERGSPADQSFAEQVEGALKVLSVTLGPAVRIAWPISGGPVPVLLLAAVVVLGYVARRDRGERFRAAGLLLVMAAAVSLAALLGWKRPESWGHVVYYGTLPLLGLGAAYYAWCLYGPPAVRRFVQMCFLGLAGALLSLNTQEGYLFSFNRHAALAGVEQDIRSGTPLSVLTRNQATAVFWPAAEDGSHQFHQKCYDSFLALRMAGVGAFREIRDDAPVVEVRVPLESAQPNNMSWEDGLAAGDDGSAWVVFPLAPGQHVSGIRLRYQHSNSKRGPAYYRYGPGPTPYFQVEWKKPDPPAYAEADRYVDVENNVGPNEEQLITFWVHDVLDELRVRPDRRPFACRIVEIVLLVPETGP